MADQERRIDVSTLPGLDSTATRHAQEAKTGKIVALVVTAVFTAVSAVLAGSTNTGCEGKKTSEERVDCQGVVDCIDHLIQKPNGAFKLEPPAETFSPED